MGGFCLLLELHCEGCALQPAQQACFMRLSPLLTVYPQTTTGTTPLLLRWTTMLGRRRTLAPGSSVNPPPAEAPTSPWESAAPSAHQGRLSALSRSTPGVGVAPKRVGQAARDLLDHPVLRDHSLTLDLCSTRCLLRVERRDPHPIPSPTCRRRLDP